MDDIIAVPNFAPRWMSLEWIHAKWRPDMDKYRQSSFLAVMECGLLFREDAIQLENCWYSCCGPTEGSWASRALRLSKPEKLMAAATLGLCVIAVAPLRRPMISGGNMSRVVCWACLSLGSVPLSRMLSQHEELPQLLLLMQEYTGLARKGLAQVRDRARHNKPSPGCEALSLVLGSQQRELCQLLHAACACLPTVCPWLAMDASAELPNNIQDVLHSQDLTKIHHLYLILQSMFLKNSSMAHLTAASKITSLHGNTKNSRIYWLHSCLYPQICQQMRKMVFALESAIRYYKNLEASNLKELKALPSWANNNLNRTSWQYSEVHMGILNIAADLRTANLKCNEIDSFLEACYKAKSKFSPSLIDSDLSKLKDDLLKCLNAVDAVEVQLKKMQITEMKSLELALQQKLPLPAVEEEETQENNVTIVSEDTEIDLKDQVFYYEKTDDAEQNACNNFEVKDYLTGPGKKEIDVTKYVLGELKIKLVKREDEMREREAIALENTMPELKGMVPEFPRQIVLDGKKDIDVACAIDAECYLELAKESKKKDYINAFDGKVDELNENKEDLQSMGDMNDRSMGYMLSGDKQNVLIEKCLKNGDLSNHNGSNNVIYEETNDRSMGDVLRDEKEILAIEKTKDDLKNGEMKTDFNGSNDLKLEGEMELNLNSNLIEHSVATKNGTEKDRFECGTSSNASIDQKIMPNLNKDNNLQDGGEHSGASNSKDSRRDYSSSDSNSGTESDSDDPKKLTLLKDVRKNRVVRKKNHQPTLQGGSKANEEFIQGEQEEGMLPIEYSFGTGLAMASLLQTRQPDRVGRPAFPSMAHEETFVGDGEVSEDSGNED